MIATILSLNKTSHPWQQRANHLHASRHLHLPDMSRYPRKLALFGVLAVALCDNCMAMNDHDQAKQLLDDGIVQPLETILALYVEHYPGPVMDIKLETQNKLILYKIDIADKNGIVQTLTINAQSGQLVQYDQLIISAKKRVSRKRATATN